MARFYGKMKSGVTGVRKIGGMELVTAIEAILPFT